MSELLLLARPHVQAVGNCLQYYAVVCPALAWFGMAQDAEVIQPSFARSPAPSNILMCALGHPAVAWQVDPFGIKNRLAPLFRWGERRELVNWREALLGELGQAGESQRSSAVSASACSEGCSGHRRAPQRVAGSIRHATPFVASRPVSQGMMGLILVCNF